MNEVIIDGCNVAECELCSTDWKNRYVCEITSISMKYNHFCNENPNCHFKQLQRLKDKSEKIGHRFKETKKANKQYKIDIKNLQAENEKLKEKSKSIAKDYVDVFIDYQKYKQALEDIREILCYGRTFYDGYFDSDKLSRTDEAIKRVNEVLNESH